MRAAWLWLCLVACKPLETERGDPPPTPDTGTVVGTGDLTDMALTANTRSVLSPILTWTTDEALPTAVELQTPDGPLSFEDPTPVTEHQVVLVGRPLEEDLEAYCQEHQVEVGVHPSEEDLEAYH